MACLVEISPRSSTYFCCLRLKLIKRSINTVNSTHHHARNETILIGDINIDLLTCNSTNTKRLTELGKTLNLIQVIDAPTRITNHTSTLVDVCFTDISHISNWFISDHRPIYISKKNIFTKG